MGRTRNIIQEIAEIRERRLTGYAIAELPIRLFAIENAFKKHDKSARELTRYFPVALIACVEGYFRMAIKELIDAGDPYLSNAEKPASSIKLDFSVLRAVHGKTVTVGELVAHSVQLSRLEHVDTVLSSLLDLRFLDELRNVTDRWDYEVRGNPSVPILSKPDQVFAGVARAFELRHIICHEIASAYEVEVDEVGFCIESCVAFLRAADELISETIHPGAPLTQAGMNIAAGESLNVVREQLEEAIIVLRSRLDKAQLLAFEESQEKWQLYCDAWVNFVAGEGVDSGTMWPVIYAGEAETVVRRRLEEVLSWKPLGN